MTPTWTVNDLRILREMERLMEWITLKVWCGIPLSSTCHWAWSSSYITPAWRTRHCSKWHHPGLSRDEYGKCLPTSWPFVLRVTRVTITRTCIGAYVEHARVQTQSGNTWHSALRGYGRRPIHHASHPDTISTFDQKCPLPHPRGRERLADVKRPISRYYTLPPPKAP